MFNKLFKLFSPISGGSSGAFSGTPSDGSVSTAKIVDEAVTLAKIADIPTVHVLGRVTAGDGAPEALTATQVLEDILDGAAIVDGDQVALGFNDSAPAVGTVELLTYSPFQWTINAVKNRLTTSGSVTATIKIDGVTVTGLSAIGLTSSSGNSAATANNVVPKGGSVSITWSSVSSAVNARGTIVGTRG